MPVDYSKMTDAELDAMLAATPKPAAKKDYAKMSDAELDAELTNTPAPMPQVLDESANLSGRFAVKNFGGDTATQIDYLKKQNPEFEVADIGGEIVARRKGEPNYRKLDPSSIELADVSDVLYDLGSGAAQTVATGVAGLGGAVAGGGVGALPAAALAGGASGAGLEGIRQALGNYLGTAKGVDKAGLAISGATGAVSPLLFGTGASAAQIGKAALNPNTAAKSLQRATTEFVSDPSLLTTAQKSVAKEYLADSQKGILTGLGPNLLSKFTGAAKPEVLAKAVEEVPESMIQTLSKTYSIDPAKKYTFLEMADVVEKQGGGDLGHVVATNIKDKLADNLMRTGDEISQALTQSNKAIDVGEYKPILDEFSNHYLGLAERAPTAEIRDQFLTEATKADELAKMFKPLQGREGAIMAPSDAMAFKNKLNEMIGGYKTPIQLDKQSAISKQLNGKLISIENKLSDRLDDVLKEEGFEGARAVYKKNKDISRLLQSSFKDDQTALNTIRNLDAQRRDVLRQTLTEIDPEITQYADLAAVNKVFGRPAANVVSSGETSTSKLLRASGLGGALGSLAGFGLAGPTGAYIGGTVGGSLGAAASSPSVVKAGLQTSTLLNRLVGGGMNKVQAQAIIDRINNATKKLPAAAQPALSKQAGAQSIWNVLNNGENK